MKFYAMVVLPSGTNINDDADISRGVQTAMAPFNQNDDDAVGFYWDYYDICERANPDFSEYPLPLKSKFVVFSPDQLTPDMLGYTLVTPEPDWQCNPDDDEISLPRWLQFVTERCAHFPGQFMVLLRCHG